MSTSRDREGFAGLGAADQLAGVLAELAQSNGVVTRAGTHRPAVAPQNRAGSV